MEKKFKVGDVVRVRKDLVIGEKYGELTLWGGRMSEERGSIGVVEVNREVGGVDISGNIFIWSEDMLEHVTHLTTKEFIRVMEDMGYELDVRTGVIFIKTKNFREVGWVRTDYECSSAFNFEFDKTTLDIFYLYANTPLELREEKEQLYTLELPNNESRLRFYNQFEDAYIFNRLEYCSTYKTHFTQKEIDNLPNQELIKTLIKKEIKEEEQ